MSEKRMRIEALIASPPTAKCEAILALLEEVESLHPEVVVIDIYLAGEQPGRTPTKGYQDKGKFKRVPSVFVNGAMAAQAEVPRRESLLALVDAELAKSSAAWLE